MKPFLKGNKRKSWHSFLTCGIKWCRFVERTCCGRSFCRGRGSELLVSWSDAIRWRWWMHRMGHLHGKINQELSCQVDFLHFDIYEVKIWFLLSFIGLMSPRTTWLHLAKPLDDTLTWRDSQSRLVYVCQTVRDFSSLRVCVWETAPCQCWVIRKWGDEPLCSEALRWRSSGVKLSLACLQR